MYNAGENLYISCCNNIVIVHIAYKRATLILKSYHSRDSQIIKHAYCDCARSLLEFSTQIWSPHLIDMEVESVQRYFTKRLSSQGAETKNKGSAKHFG